MAGWKVVGVGYTWRVWGCEGLWVLLGRCLLFAVCYLLSVLWRWLLSKRERKGVPMLL